MSPSKLQGSCRAPPAKLRGNLRGPRSGGKYPPSPPFVTEHAVVDRIINHLELTFVSDQPPLARVYITVGDEPELVKEIEAFPDILKTENPHSSSLKVP